VWSARNLPEVIGKTSAVSRKLGRANALPQEQHHGKVRCETAQESHNVAVKCADKILSPATLPGWREQLRREGRKLVVTNGCFDLLHAGHVTYLEAARNQGDALLVGVNSDAAVRGLKGPGRPVNSESDRALVIAALQSVDGVFIFHERDAVEFLKTVGPDIYVKGGDYTIDTINQDERRFIEQVGGKIVLLAHVPGKSTTSLLQKISTH
jgi:D-glycero-beta-D-manno-heptose 1-phosphate adenylyltransferase